MSIPTSFEINFHNGGLFYLVAGCPWGYLVHLLTVSLLFSQFFFHSFSQNVMLYLRFTYDGYFSLLSLLFVKLVLLCSQGCISSANSNWPFLHSVYRSGTSGITLCLHFQGLWCRLVVHLGMPVINHYLTSTAFKLPG